jgi:hypothetical protein
MVNGVGTEQFGIKVTPQAITTTECLEFAVYRLYMKTNGCSLMLRAAKLLLFKAATLTTAMRASSLSRSPGAS